MILLFKITIFVLFIISFTILNRNDYWSTVILLSLECTFLNFKYFMKRSRPNVIIVNNSATLCRTKTKNTSSIQLNLYHRRREFFFFIYY
jgi:hypothetical protein